MHFLCVRLSDHSLMDERTYYKDENIDSLHFTKCTFPYFSRETTTVSSVHLTRLRCVALLLFFWFSFFSSPPGPTNSNATWHLGAKIY